MLMQRFTTTSPLLPSRLPISSLITSNSRPDRLVSSIKHWLAGLAMDAQLLFTNVRII